jgi:dTDP-4-dehydrorhamnose reductase
MAANDLAYFRRRSELAMQKPRPILVAGQTGQLASALVVLAGQRRLPLVAIGRPELEMTNAGSIEKVVETHSPCAIVNAAAYTQVDKAESEPDLAFKINCDGAAYLAQVAARLNVPFIHVSTDYVFDGNKPTPYDEDDDASPLNVYGRSKWQGETAVLRAYPAAIILRTSWIYSPYGQNFVKTMLRLSKTHDHIRVVDDQHGAPSSARDLAQAILQIIEQIEGGAAKYQGGIYHLTAAGETTWYGFASAIFADWAGRGWRVPTLEAITTADYPTPARRPHNSRLNCSKAAQVFGIRLPTWQQGIELCLDELALSEVGAHVC